jgi:hypothetical protein
MYGDFLGGLLGLLLVLLAWTVLFVLPVVLVCLWEKRLVWPYVPAGEPDSLPADHPSDSDNPYASPQMVEGPGTLAATDYALRAKRDALALGFESLGVFRDGKGPMYRIRYDFVLSPEGDVLAEIGGGMIGVFRFRGTFLYTQLADGRCLVTVDRQMASDVDLAGLIDEALVRWARFGRLLDRHRRRVAAAPVAAVPYSKEDPLGDLKAFCIRWTGRLEEFGFVRFLEPTRTAWRYTLKGALIWSTRALLRGIRRVVIADR